MIASSCFESFLVDPTIIPSTIALSIFRALRGREELGDEGVHALLRDVVAVVGRLHLGGAEDLPRRPSVVSSRGCAFGLFFSHAQPFFSAEAQLLHELIAPRRCQPELLDLSCGTPGVAERSLSATRSLGARRSSPKLGT